MKRYTYTYLQVEKSKVEENLILYSSAGWRVHTFFRNLNATIVDILLEREVD